MLSVTDPDEAWQDFQLSRMTVGPIESANVDPEVLELFPGALESFAKQLGLGSPPQNGSNSSATNDSAHPKVAGALENGAAARSSASSGYKGAAAALLDKYAPAVVGLLAGNIAVMLLLCAISLFACMRRDRAKSKSVPADYAPVSFKDKGDEDLVASEPIRGYGE